MFNGATEEMISELYDSEVSKLRSVDEMIKGNELISSSVFHVLSNIAFEMAMRSCDSNENYGVAAVLGKNAKTLFDSDRVSLHDKNQLKSEMSEAFLDFNYAAGNKRIASLRMAPYIRSKNAKG